MRIVAALLGACLLAGCVTGQNYISPAGPRFAGGTSEARPHRLHGDTLTAVTFNIENGMHIDSAVFVLTTTPELRDADIVLLQEVDDAGARRVASALRMSYVFYPAALRKNIKRDWGNAVLTCWPIIADQKLVLPHIGKLAKTLRTTTAVTIRVDTTTIRVYSTHLGTIWNVGPGKRADQLRVVLADAQQYRHVLLGGDMNSSSVGKEAVALGYLWPTLTIPRTERFGQLDHFFVKGLRVPYKNAADVTWQNHHASDHRPVWLKFLL